MLTLQHDRNLRTNSSNRFDLAEIDEASTRFDEIQIEAAEWHEPEADMDWRGENDSRDHEWDPTPEEIAARCAEIQSTWSARDRARRTVVKQIPWGVPCCRVATLMDVLSDAG